jgi:FdhE protein
MGAILQPGEIEPPKGNIPFLRLPDGRDVFAARARRFHALAEGHALGDYLHFMGRLAEAQQAALDDLPPVPLLTGSQIEVCRLHGLPPLGAQGWQRDPAWRGALKHILAAIGGGSMPAAIGEALARLEGADGEELETLAGALLRRDFQDVPAEVAPFLAAALQVYWTSMATRIEEKEFGRLEQPNLCPVCGSLPVASIVRVGGDDNGLRYLCCSLCASQWHMVRIKCVNCDSTKGISYFGIEGDAGVVRAETCDECNTYLKIMKMEKDPHVEPVADDLAMLALDMLMDQAGRRRSGPNLLFHPGSE